MADRLTKIGRIKQGLGFVHEHVAKGDWQAAIVVQAALLEQLLALIEGENLDSVSDPDVVIRFDQDCGDGEDQQPEQRG